MIKLGVIVNPVAGLGGRVGLKGSDGPAVQQLALARGARPEAPLRAAEALSRLSPLAGGMAVLTWPGAMGGDVCRQAGFDPRMGPAAAGGVTTGADTMAAACWMLAESVDLILFVGGDGTARDICSAVGERIPALGVPAGVKIHSAVFAVTPRSAGMAARRFLEQGPGRCRTAEVMDIDEDAFRHGKVSARLFGALQVPDVDRFIQGAKVGGGPSEAGMLGDIAQEVIEQIQKDPAGVYIIGPGTTTRAVKRHFGIPGTLLGVDVVSGGRVVAEDADERTLLHWIADRPARIIVTVIGGQGYLFGRGNQQISPRVIRAVGRRRIVVVATREKLLGLHGRPLLVDTGDSDLDRDLAGHMRVVTGYRHTTMCRVGL